MRLSLLLSACLVAIASLAFADDKEKKEDKNRSEPTITPSTMSVARKLDQEEFPTSFERTTLWFVVRVPKKTLLGIDNKGSKIDKFADDKGNSLVANRGVFQQVHISTDRSAMEVAVSVFNKCPGKGASKLVLKGELSLEYGTDEKSEEMKKVKFEAKNTAKAGDFEITVTHEKGNFGGIEGPIFTLKSKTRRFKGVTIKDAEGTEFEVRQYVPFSRVGGDPWMTSFGVKKPLKEGTVTVHYFSKEEKVKVPVDLTVGLDLNR